MADNLRYSGIFYDKSGNRYDVMIYDSLYSGESKTVTLTDNPVTLSEDDDNDILKAIRCKTGTINLMDRGDLETLTPHQDHQFFVRIHKNVFSIIFQGYIKCEGAEQDWIAPPVEITYNIESGISSILDYELKTGWAGSSGYINYAQAIKSAVIDRIGYAFNRIYIAAAYYLMDDNDAPDFLSLLKLRLSATVYEPEDDSEDDEGKSVEDLLTDFCTLFGLTVRESGQNLYFCHPTCDYYYWITPDELSVIGDGTSELVITTGSDRLLSRSEIEMSSLSYAGDGQKKTAILGEGKYIVKMSLDRVDDVLPEISTDGWVPGDWKRGQLTQNDSNADPVKNELQASSFITGWNYTAQDTEKLELYSYDISSDGQTVTRVEQEEPETITGVAPFRYYAGAHLVEADLYNAKQSGTEMEKKTFSYAKMLVISNTWMSRALSLASQNGNCIPTLEQKAGKTPLAVFRGDKPVRLSSGALAVNASVLLQSFTFRSTYSYQYTLFFRIRIGDWVSFQTAYDGAPLNVYTMCRFVNVNSAEYADLEGKLCYLRTQVPDGVGTDSNDESHNCDFGQVADTRLPVLTAMGTDSYQPYGDASGVVIECRDPDGNYITVEGDFELTLYGFYDYSTINGKRSTWKDIFDSSAGTGTVDIYTDYLYAFIKDLSVKYYENDEVTAREKLRIGKQGEDDADDYQYVAVSNVKLSNNKTETIDLTVGTGEKTDTAYNLLLRPGGELLENIYCYEGGKGTERRPEEQLCRLLEQLKLRNRIRYQLEVELTDDMDTPSSVVHDGDKDYLITARDYSLVDGSATITIDEL